MDLPMTAPHPTSTLLDNFERQDQVFAPAFSILQEAITQQAFPAASVAVTYRNQLIILKALGHLTYDAGAPFLASFARKPALSLSKEPALSLSKGGIPRPRKPLSLRSASALPKNPSLCDGL